MKWVILVFLLFVSSANAQWFTPSDTAAMVTSTLIPPPAPSTFLVLNEAERTWFLKILEQKNLTQKTGYNRLSYGFLVKKWHIIKCINSAGDSAKLLYDSAMKFINTIDSSNLRIRQEKAGWNMIAPLKKILDSSVYVQNDSFIMYLDLPLKPWELVPEKYNLKGIYPYYSKDLSLLTQDLSVFCRKKKLFNVEEDYLGLDILAQLKPDGEVEIIEILNDETSYKKLLKYLNHTIKYDSFIMEDEMGKASKPQSIQNSADYRFLMQFTIPKYNYFSTTDYTPKKLNRVLKKGNTIRISLYSLNHVWIDSANPGQSVSINRNLDYKIGSQKPAIFNLNDSMQLSLFLAEIERGGEKVHLYEAHLLVNGVESEYHFYQPIGIAFLYEGCFFTASDSKNKWYVTGRLHFNRRY